MQLVFPIMPLARAMGFRLLRARGIPVSQQPNRSLPRSHTEGIPRQLVIQTFPPSSRCLSSPQPSPPAIHVRPSQPAPSELTFSAPILCNTRHHGRRIKPQVEAPGRHPATRRRSKFACPPPPASWRPRLRPRTRSTAAPHTGPIPLDQDGSC